MSIQSEKRSTRTLSLSHGLVFEDLYDRAGMVRLDELFLSHLREAASALCDRLLAARKNPRRLRRSKARN